jgi:erythromycin esterase-like protein
MRALALDRQTPTSRSAGHVIDIARHIGSLARPLRGDAPDLDPLLDAIGDARFVLIGEATHGTHEFFELRAAITRRLIMQKSFNMVAVEGDWPDANRVNRYVRGKGTDSDARAALGSFERFPTWMWRNSIVLEFVKWLRHHNQLAPREVGFYGLDLYSLHSSIGAALASLEAIDPAWASDARERFGCFDSFGGDAQRYGYTTSFGDLPACEDSVVEQLVRLGSRRVEVRGMGISAADDLFVAEQNARMLKNAESYYRAMYRGGIASWNLRDTHMADTLDALASHFGGSDGPPKVVVWAHNSHVGDARATELGAEGEINLGELTRQRHPNQTFLLGLSTYEGSVTAASHWGGAPERKRIVRALPGSHEELFHHAPSRRFLLLPEVLHRMDELAKPRLQRAIGVTYRPTTERQSHYYRSQLSEQFDALIHLDETRAVEPVSGFE